MPRASEAFLLDRGVHPRTHLSAPADRASRERFRRRLETRQRRKIMTPALLGKKIGMTRVYDAKGRVLPVTVVEAGPCAVTQVKTIESDGYNAVQLGFEEAKAKHCTQGVIGHCAKSGISPQR